MTPTEKAEEIVFKYEKYLYGYFTTDEEYARCVECALIAVDEILDLIDTIYDYDRESLNPYWQEVKQEIDKL
jgi:hypothetical protein